MIKYNKSNDQTDMFRVRDLAKSLLYVDIHETKLSPMVVQHPFTSSGIIGIPTKDGVDLVNICESKEQLEQWREFTAKQIEECDSPLKVYMLINKPYALTFLSLASPCLSQEDYSGILADAWMRSENPNRDANVSRKQLVEMFMDANPKYLMDNNERLQLSELPDVVTIYRGVTPYNEKNIRALSWSLDYDTANWFAHRYGEDGTVYQAQIPKAHILALFNGRNESEIIVDPKYLKEIEQMPEQDFGLTL